jgi:hypothetical protein
MLSGRWQRISSTRGTKFMAVVIRKLLTIIEEQRIEGGAEVSPPLIKVAAVAVIKNPLVGKIGADLAPLIEVGGDLGVLLAERIFEVLPKSDVKSFGKSAIVGADGELEHAAALIHPTFGKRMRVPLGRGRAVIPSSKKSGGEGCSIDVPLVYTEALSVASHYDSMEIRVHDAPHPDEVVVALVMTNGGRPHARIPGLQLRDVKGQDGVS